MIDSLPDDADARNQYPIAEWLDKAMADGHWHLHSRVGMDYGVSKTMVLKIRNGDMWA